LGRIFQAHWHPQKLKQAERRNDRRFGDVIGMDRYLVVSFDEIHLRANALARQV
jgi:hypothetical protein